MDEPITWVGLDVSKRQIAVAALIPGRSQPYEFTLANRAGVASRILNKVLRAGAEELRTCYEAAGFGWKLQRQFRELGVHCMVVAPALVPRKPGDLVKTDRGDARHLAEQLKAGALTEVTPPSKEQEAFRDLCRARAAARSDLMRARHRLSKFLDRHELKYPGKNWTQGHGRWLDQIVFEQPYSQLVFERYRFEVEHQAERVSELTRCLEQGAQTEPYATPVAYLRSFRGLDTVSAVTLVAELYAIGRFPSPRQLMKYLGMTPQLYASGQTERRGSITKAGNSLVRRTLVEAAWHYRHRPSIGPRLKKRREGQPQWVLQVSNQAQRRLHTRFRHLVLHRGKQPNKAVVAMARELAGFVWAVLYRHAQQQAPSAAASRASALSAPPTAALDPAASTALQSN